MEGQRHVRLFILQPHIEVLCVDPGWAAGKDNRIVL